MSNRRCFYYLNLLLFTVFPVLASGNVSIATHSKLVADDAFTDAGFGWAVAIDGNTAVVSAFADYDNLGAAYIYEKTSSGWRQMSKLTASDGVGGTNGDFLGISAAVSGDTVVLGAALDDNENGTNAGAVYVYEKPAEGWPAAMTETAKIKALSSGDDRGFGAAISLEGDILVVGSPGKDTSMEPGEVFVFQRVGDNWEPRATFKVDGLKGGDSYGAALDFDGQTIVVGAFGQDKSKGAIYVYHKPADGWSDKAHDAMLSADGGRANDYFGGSVAVDGNSILVGANGDDASGAKSGAAYLFKRSGGNWVQQQKLLASDGGPVENFGYSVDLAGNMAIVGASHPNDKAADSIYFFSRLGNEWVEQGKITDPDAKKNSKFGLSVAVDSNGRTILSGAIRADAGDVRSQKDAGAAYLYQLMAPIDLSLVIKDDLDPATVGDEVTYTLMVTNRGDSDATGVIVEDTLPVGVRYLSDDGNCTVSEQVVRCELGIVGKNGGMASVAISVRAEDAGQVTNSATVRANETDADGSDNSDSEQTTIRSRDSNDSNADNGDGGAQGGSGGGGTLDLWLLMLLLAVTCTARLPRLRCGRIHARNWCSE